MKEKIKFVIKVALLHTVSYFICGLIFSKLFNYEILFKLQNVQYFMRDAYGISSLFGPFVQIIRGAVIGCVFLMLKDNLLKRKNAWLYVWLLFVGLGIICTPAASPASIEGLVYSQLPLEFHLKILPELLVQTLLFSLWITSDFKFNIPDKIKQPVVVTIISAVGFSIGGIILSLVLGIDVMSGASDPFAYFIMLIALIIVFLMTRFCLKNKVIYYVFCYFALAGLPTIYNYATNSVLKSPLSLVFSGLPVIVIAIYLTYINKQQTKEG